MMRKSLPARVCTIKPLSNIWQRSAFNKKVKKLSIVSWRKRGKSGMKR